MATVAFCTECGAGIASDFAFCPECGSTVAPTAAAAPPASPGATRTSGRAPQVDVPWEEPGDSPWEGYGVDAAWPAATAGRGSTARSGSGSSRVLPASFARRLGARLVDTALLTVIELVALALSYALVVGPAIRSANSDDAGLQAAFSALVLYLVWPLLGVLPTFLYFTWSEARGQTVGKSALGIRVETSDGAPLGAARAFRRTLANTLSSVFFGLGQLAMLWDPQRRTWPDRWSTSRVVRVTPASEPFPSAGIGPLAAFAVLIVGLMLALPSLVQSTGDNITARGPTIADPAAAVSGGATGTTRVPSAPTATTALPTATGSLVNPCDLVTKAEITRALGVEVGNGELGSSEPKRLQDGGSIQSRGRQKCTFLTTNDMVISKLYQSSAFLVFTEQYTTDSGATAAFASLRDMARIRVLADTAPLGPVGETTASRGFSEQLGVGSESLVFWSISRWSASDPSVVTPTTVDPSGPTPQSRAEFGYFGLEFRVGTTCVVVALPGRFGSPSDFPAIQRDAVNRLRGLAETVSTRLKARS